MYGETGGKEDKLELVSDGKFSPEWTGMRKSNRHGRWDKRSLKRFPHYVIDFYNCNWSETANHYFVWCR